MSSLAKILNAERAVKIQRLKDLDELEGLFIQKARMDVNAFIEYVMEDESGNPLIQYKLQREIQDHISNNTDALIEVPRGHGKTTQLVGRTLFALGNNPNLRIKYIQANEDKAKKWLAEVTTNIEKNERLHKVFPDLRPADRGQWSKQAIFVNRTFISKDPSVEALGVFSSGVGGRWDFLISDDICDLKNAILEPARREQVKEAYRNVWRPMSSANARSVNIFTPWHSADLNQDLKRESLEEGSPYKLLSRPCNNNFLSPCPELFPPSRLKKLLGEIQRRAYDRAYRLLPLSDEDLPFSLALDRAIDRETKLEDVDRKDWTYYMGVDLAFNTTLGSPRTSIFVLGVDRGGYKYPVFCRVGRFKPKRIVEHVLTDANYWNVRICRVEDNSAQTALLDWIKIEQVAGRESGKYKRGVSIKGHYTGSGKRNPSSGIPGMAVDMESGNWRILLGGHLVSCTCGLCEWVREVGEYPLSELDDTVMSSWFAAEAVNKMRAPKIRSFNTSTRGDVEEEVISD